MNHSLQETLEPPGKPHFPTEAVALSILQSQEKLREQNIEKARQQGHSFRARLHGYPQDKRNHSPSHITTGTRILLRIVEQLQCNGI